jgi:hypothetical protein
MTGSANGGGNFLATGRITHGGFVGAASLSRMCAVGGHCKNQCKQETTHDDKFSD